MKTIFLIFFVFIFSNAVAQNHYYPIKKNNIWGIINQKGEIECNPKYEFIDIFNNKGYAVVRQKDKMSIIDGRGNLIFPFVNKTLKLLDNNFIAFKDTLVWGVMDFSQKIILPATYQQIEQIKNIDTNSPLDYLIIFKDKNNLKGCINKKGEVLCEAIYRNISFITNEINSSQREIIALKDSFVWVDSGKLLYAKGTETLTTLGTIKKNTTQSNRRGNSTPIQNSTENIFKEQAIITNLKDKNGLYDLKEDKIVVPILYSGYQITKNKILFYDKNTLKGIYANHQFGVMPGEGFEQMIPDTINGVNIAKIKNGKWGIINQNYVPLSAFIYDDISNFNQNLAQIKQGNLYGLMNTKGVVVAPVQYMSVRMQGFVAKLFKDKNGNCTVYTFNAKGDVIDQYDAILKSITVKNASREGQAEWEFFKRNIKNAQDFEVNNVRRTGINLEHPNDEIEADYQTESFETSACKLQLNVSKIAQKATWTIHLKNHKTLYSDHIYVSKDKTIAMTFWRQIDKNGQISNTTFFINLDKGLEIVRKRFIDVISINQDLQRLENGEYILISTENALVNREINFIGNTNYINPLTKKLENTPISYIESNNVLGTPYQKIVVKAVYKYKNSKDIQSGIYGLIDSKTGKIIAIPQYNHIKTNEGFIKVFKGNRRGILDTNGKELCPVIYNDVTYLSEDKKYYKIWETERKMYTVIDTTGKIYFNFKYDNFQKFSNGVACVQKNKNWGIILPNGTEILKPTYSIIRTASEGFLAFREGNLFGFLDTKGQIAIEANKYSQVGDFKNGMAWVIEKGKYGAINTKGELLIAPKFRKIENFYGNVALAQEKEDWGLIDTKGNWIIKPSYKVHYSNQVYPEVQRLVLSDAPLEDILLDFKGRKLSGKYEKISPFSENFAVVKKNNQYNFINLEGKEISSQSFQDLESFSEGLAVFTTKNGLKGFIDTTGKIVIEPKYKSSTSFYKGFAKVKDNQKTYFIDYTGEEKKLPLNLNWKEEEIDVMNVRIPQKDKSYKIVSKNGYFGLIDNKEIWICPAKYQSISEFSEGYAFVGATYFQGLLDLNGKSIIEAENEDITWAGNNIFAITQYGKLGYWNLSNTWIWALQN